MRLLYCLIMFMLFAHAGIALPVQQLENVEEPEAESDEDTSLFSRPPAHTSLKKNPEKELQEEMEQENRENQRIIPPLSPQKAKLEAGYNRVVLLALNKVTARATRLVIEVGSHARFGTLDINVRSCWRSAAGLQEENTALIDIYEIKSGETPRKIFLGWLFSSSPSLVALEHPFYDISVIQCEKDSKEEKK